MAMAALSRLRISPQDAQRAGPLELGALPDSPTAPEASAGVDHARHGGRGRASRKSIIRTRTASCGNFEKCAAAVVMIDAVQLKEGNREQDFFVMKLLSYLSELNNDPRTGWTRRPLRWC